MKKKEFMELVETIGLCEALNKLSDEYVWTYKQLIDCVKFHTKKDTIYDRRIANQILNRVDRGIDCYYWDYNIEDARGIVSIDNADDVPDYAFED